MAWFALSNRTGFICKASNYGLPVHKAGRVASSRNDRLIITTGALSTVSCVFPGLAAGSLAVQASADFGVSEGSYGWALGSFFLGAAVTSAPFGQLGQRLGARRQLSLSLVAVALTQLAIAFVVPTFGWMLAALAAAGMINSAAQTAVNLALSQAQLPRLGLAIATKQSAMPASSMLGGLAVPALALTLGWRWAYAMGALVALVALALTRRHIHDSPPAARAAASTSATNGSSPRRALLGAAVVSLLLAFSSGAINAWTVSSGVDAGLGEGTAGLLLSVAAGTGVAVRLLIGSRIDASTVAPMRQASFIYLAGIVGFVLLSVRVAGVHAAASILAFAGGWVWPVSTNFAIISANRTRAASATGISQTGVYIGVFSAPIITGQIIDRAGYRTMWIVVAAVGVLAAVGLRVLSRSFPRTHPPLS